MAHTHAGDILIMVADNSEHGSFTYEQKSGSDLNYSPGGLVSEAEEDGITNAGNIIRRLTKKRGKITGEVVMGSDALEYTRKTGESAEFTTYTITLGNGEVVKALGFPVNSQERNTQKGTSSIEIHTTPIKFN